MTTSKHNKSLIVILGPTAVGKTVVSVALAKRLLCSVINADSRQLFKELSIGTAKPTKEEMQGVKHYFVDDRSIEEEISAGKFEKETLEILKSEFEENDTCILSGGSGLYIDAVCNGLDSFPIVEPEIRNKLNIELATNGVEQLYEELKEIDSDYADIVEPNNSQRIIRALEIYRASGKIYSSLRQGLSFKREFDTYFIGLERPREELYNRINKRIDIMIENGLFEEAKGLIDYREKNALQTVGYNEVFQYLDGTIDKLEAIRILKRNSRRYAKRQMTWFKRNQETKWFHPEAVDNIYAYIKSLL